MRIFRIKQYVCQDFYLSCLGCCRYNCSQSIWAPNLLEEEKKALNLEKIELIAYNQSYICCFLNPENNLCRIYNQRPLECRLYPFLLNRYDRKLYLSLHCSCLISNHEVEGRSRTINNKEFKQYLNYLVRYLKSPSVSTILNRNLEVFSSYSTGDSTGEVLNLAELKI